MLKQNGKAFIDFARDFVKGTKETGTDGDDVYLPPSESWSSAVDLPEPWPERIKFVFTQLSFQCNEFFSMHTRSLSFVLPSQHAHDPGNFIARTLMSIVQDQSTRSRGMDKATDLGMADGNLALTWAKTWSSQRDKPLIRCENCTKTAQEIGGNPKFMVCSNCRSKLDFVVHYCSK
jgi:hypothetical protein